MGHTGVIPRRAGCSESCTSGSEGGPGKRTGRKPGTAPRSDPYTEIPTWQGKLYLAVVIDCYSRRCVGWALADHLRAEIVVDALEMAVSRRRPDAGLVHHSDQGSQYTSLVFTRRCRSVGIDVSMGSRGDCFDNSPHESFHASLKKDLICRRSWPTKAEARTAVFEYIEAFFRGRDGHCWPPPAQIPACASNALGS